VVQNWLSDSLIPFGVNYCKVGEHYKKNKLLSPQTALPGYIAPEDVVTLLPQGNFAGSASY
jgi:hypothetical protein